MNNSFLFPTRCKALGWIVAIPTLVTGIIMLSDGASAMWSWLAGYFDELVLTVLTVALLLVAFARERIEDEYTACLRTRSLVLAIITNYVVLMVGTYFFFDVAYLNFIIANLFTPLLIYILHFNISMTRFKNSVPNE